MIFFDDVRSVPYLCYHTASWTRWDRWRSGGLRRCWTMTTDDGDGRLLAQYAVLRDARGYFFLRLSGSKHTRHHRLYHSIVSPHYPTILPNMLFLYAFFCTYDFTLYPFSPHRLLTFTLHRAAFVVDTLRLRSVYICYYLPYHLVRTFCFLYNVHYTLLGGCLFAYLLVFTAWGLYLICDFRLTPPLILFLLFGR